MELRLKWVAGLILSFSFSAFARPQFEKATLILGKKTITVELAKTDEQRSYGLMNLNKMEKNQGMLFIFEDEAQRSFWMKDTFIDLSIAFFDQNKKIIDLQEMKATTMLQANLPTYDSSKPAMYALEMNKGWFERNRIKIGDHFQFKKNK